ncbi:MAG: mechanosensitive ion channel family protein [Alphaproteobacteria bacterium]
MRKPQLDRKDSTIADYIFNINHVEFLTFIATIFISFIGGLGLAWVLTRTIRVFGGRNKSYMDALMRRNIRIPLFILFPLIGVFIGLWLFYPAVLNYEAVHASLKVLLVVTLVWLTLRIVKTISVFVENNFDITNEDNLRARAVHTQITLIRRITGFVVVVVGLASFFLLFENLHTIGVSLIASAGVAGIVLGFAAQKTLGNLLAGIQIAIAQPIRIDDAVFVENEWGWIEEITLTYVVVKIWDLRRLVVPISYFIEKPFQNWTRNSAAILGSVFLYTDYTMPIDAIRSKLAEILDGNEKWDGKAQVVQVTECKPDTMEIRILVSAKNSPTTWELRCEVREKLITFIQENYPHALPRTRAELVKDGAGAVKYSSQ